MSDEWRSQQVDITDDVIAEAVVTAAPTTMNKRAPNELSTWQLILMIMTE